MIASQTDAMVHHKSSACRACGALQLERFLELGPTPLANAFLRAPTEFEEERAYPLDVYYCHGCSLVQLLDVIDPETLFGEYIYVSGTSETVAAHNIDYAKAVVEGLGLGADDLVIEIASNDGSLLKCFKQHGVRTLGVEPARNIAKQAVEAGIETVNEFFDTETARAIGQSHGEASAVVANNVLAHVDDPRGFLRGCRDLLKEDGRVLIEVPYLRKLLDNLEYDTVYHEHLCYFSVVALLKLFELSGLRIVHIDQVPIHGGSLRIWGARDTACPEHGESVLALANEERALGLTDAKCYHDFAERVARSRESLRGLLKDLGRDATVAGYGAPAKGNTLLNYCGIDNRVLPFTVDKNPLKVGCYTPGMHIPVLPVSAVADRKPDYLLVLAWNFAEEIMRQQDEFRRQGGRFIIPIPEATVVG